MMAHKTFVVPLDGSERSERAIAVAVALADRVRGHVMLVTAAEGGPLHPSQYLEERAAALRAGGCDVELCVAGGAPVATIVDVLTALDDPVVCMTTHGRGRFRWAALGSVAEEIVRRGAHPIVLVGRNCHDDFLVRSSRMLACVDDDKTADGLAPTVDEWAEHLGLSVDVAVVVHPLDVVSAERERDVLAAVSAPFAAVRHAVMISGRFVAGSLADHADAMPAAMIAMRSHARSGVARVALGSVTMGVVHLANCPVLVVPERGDDPAGATGRGGES